MKQIFPILLSLNAYHFLYAVLFFLRNKCEPIASIEFDCMESHNCLMWLFIIILCGFFIMCCSDYIMLCGFSLCVAVALLRFVVSS